MTRRRAGHPLEGFATYRSAAGEKSSRATRRKSSNSFWVRRRASASNCGVRSNFNDGAQVGVAREQRQGPEGIDRCPRKPPPRLTRRARPHVARPVATLVSRTKPGRPAPGPADAARSLHRHALRLRPEHRVDRGGGVAGDRREARSHPAHGHLRTISDSCGNCSGITVIQYFRPPAGKRVLSASIMNACRTLGVTKC